MKSNMLPLILLVLLVSCRTAVKEPFKVSLGFHRPRLTQIDTIEKLNNGVRVDIPFDSMPKDHFPGAANFDLAAPIQFLRDTAGLRTAVTYFYSKTDSIVRLVEYSWNDSGRHEDEIGNLFELTDSMTSRYFRKAGKETVNKQSDWTETIKIWDADSVYVKQSMTSNKKPMRTVVLVSWK